MLVLLAAVATGAMAQTNYKVSVKEGTEDATSWTIAPAEATTTGVAAGTTVTATYSGTKKVKSVKAKKPDLLSGVFSVSASKKVKVSKGNLRYASGAWSFFDNQYDYYTSYSANAWDKFGWSTSKTTYGMNTSTTASTYSGNFVDWGATMGAGWFTLSNAEWTYLFNTRTVNGGTGSGKSYTLGQKVNNKPGVVIYPDNYTGDVYSGSDWATFESAGCVFLPIANLRDGTKFIGSTRGCYWSSTSRDADEAYYVNINTTAVQPNVYSNRKYGLSVRLVREVPSN